MADIVNNIWIFRLIELTPVLCHRDATRRPTKKAQSKLLLIGPGMFSKAECQVPATKGGKAFLGQMLSDRPGFVSLPSEDVEHVVPTLRLTRASMESAT